MYYLRKTNIKILQTIKAVEKANNGNKESVPVWSPKALNYQSLLNNQKILLNKQKLLKNHSLLT